MHNKSIKELALGLRSGAFSSVELTQTFLARVKQHESLNCFISVTEDLAIKAAKRADQMIAEGKDTLLTGIPIAQKDIFCTQGVKTTCGSKMLDNFIAPYNATVVEKLNEAGAVMLGKLNMDEFAWVHQMKPVITVPSKILGKRIRFQVGRRVVLPQPLQRDCQFVPQVLIRAGQSGNQQPYVVSQD